MAVARKNTFNSKAGFTLIEMLVVVAIFAVVATVLLFNYSSFSTSVGVRNLSEEIGLSVRKAQTYATSVRSIAGTNGITSDMFPAYGESFSVNETAQQVYDPTSTNFPLFVDVADSAMNTSNNIYNNNGICGNPASGQECVESFGVTTGVKIISLCTDVPYANSCLTASTGGRVNVVFHRPSPDAVICVETSTGACNAQSASYLKITLQSPKGLQRVVTIWNTGQISVN
jgi:prepilin-type N-terminal cleavage/methylation domain-containing protein